MFGVVRHLSGREGDCRHGPRKGRPPELPDKLRELRVSAAAEDHLLLRRGPQVVQRRRAVPFAVATAAAVVAAAAACVVPFALCGAKGVKDTLSTRTQDEVGLSPTLSLPELNVNKRMQCGSPCSAFPAGVFCPLLQKELRLSLFGALPSVKA